MLTALRSCCRSVRTKWEWPRLVIFAESKVPETHRVPMGLDYMRERAPWAFPIATSLDDFELALGCSGPIKM